MDNRRDGHVDGDSNRLLFILVRIQSGYLYVHMFLVMGVPDVDTTDAQNYWRYFHIPATTGHQATMQSGLRSPPINARPAANMLAVLLTACAIRTVCLLVVRCKCSTHAALSLNHPLSCLVSRAGCLPEWITNQANKVRKTTLRSRRLDYSTLKRHATEARESRDRKLHQF